MAGLAFCLYSEYRFFQREYAAMQELKQEYVSRLAMLKYASPKASAQGVAFTMQTETIITVAENLFTHMFTHSLPAVYFHSLYFFDCCSTIELSKQQPDATGLVQFILPIERSKFWLSSYFGMRKEPNGTRRFHYGIDLAALKKTPVMAAADGIVEEVNDDPIGYGKNILIKHDKGYKTRYAHLDSIAVKKEQTVYAGTIIGRVGDTGNVRKQGRDASHLHFELYELGKRVNPLYFLEYENVIT